MFIILLAFAGAYPCYETPLDIARTVGTIRAITCVITLAAIASLSVHSLSLSRTVPVIAFAGSLLVFQHELVSGLLKRSSVRRSPRQILSRVPCFDEPEIHSVFVFERDFGHLLKRSIDIIGAVALLTTIFPFGVAVAALIKVNSKGPVFLRQRRVGRNGEPFLMWKFRSMYVDAPLYARSPTTDRDPRLTKFGRSLRRYSLDELPQLWNVLKGEMSLVGPRPEMPFIAKEYGDYERLRLNATPGITGLWQISPARAMPIHENLELDLYYIGHRSFFLDLAILIRTVTAVLRGIGAR
jgi:lipopolysaccharide/colanic/teichoic acid biosynthesis glycosyltransferase